MLLSLLAFFIIGSVSVREIDYKGLEVVFEGADLTPQNLSFDGASWIENEGEPNLPSINYLIGLPQDGNVEVVIQENQEQRFKGIDIEPVIPIAIYETPGPEPAISKSTIYLKNSLYPENLVQVSNLGYLRDIWTATVKINPIRYNPVTKELVISKKLRIRIEFKGQPKSLPITDDSFESIYKRTIINYEQCKCWRRERTRQNRENPFGNGIWFKILVGEEGLYKIGYDEIRKAGIDPRQFDPKTMKVYTALFELLSKNVTINFPDSLIEIPVYVEGEEDHTFDRGDYLVFYGFHDAFL